MRELAVIGDTGGAEFRALVAGQRRADRFVAGGFANSVALGSGPYMT